MSVVVLRPSSARPSDDALIAHQGAVFICLRAIDLGNLFERFSTPKHMDEMSEEFNSIANECELSIQMRGVHTRSKTEIWRDVFAKKRTLEDCLQTFVEKMEENREYNVHINRHLYMRILNIIRERVKSEKITLTRKEERYFTQSIEDIERGYTNPVESADELFYHCFPKQYDIWRLKQKSQRQEE